MIPRVLVWLHIRTQKQPLEWVTVLVGAAAISTRGLPGYKWCHLNVSDPYSVQQASSIFPCSFRGQRFALITNDCVACVTLTSLPDLCCLRGRTLKLANHNKHFFWRSSKKSSKISRAWKNLGTFFRQSLPALSKVSPVPINWEV